MDGLVSKIENKAFYYLIGSSCRDYRDCFPGYNCKKFWKEFIGMCVPGKLALFDQESKEVI